MAPIAGTISQVRLTTTIPWLQSSRVVCGGRCIIRYPSAAELPIISRNDAAGADSPAISAHVSGSRPATATTTRMRPRLYPIKRKSSRLGRISMRLPGEPQHEQGDAESDHRQGHHNGSFEDERRDHSPQS